MELLIMATACHLYYYQLYLKGKETLALVCNVPLEVAISTLVDELVKWAKLLKSTQNGKWPNHLGLARQKSAKLYSKCINHPRSLYFRQLYYHRSNIALQSLKIRFKIRKDIKLFACCIVDVF